MITINVLTVHGAASSLILNNITYYLYNTIWIIHLEFHLFIKYWLGSFQDFCFVYHLTIQFDLTEWAEVIYKNPQLRQWQNDLRSSKKFSFNTCTMTEWAKVIQKSLFKTMTEWAEVIYKKFTFKTTTEWVEVIWKTITKWAKVIDKISIFKTVIECAEVIYKKSTFKTVIKCESKKILRDAFGVDPPIIFKSLTKINLNIIIHVIQK